MMKKLTDSLLITGLAQLKQVFLVNKAQELSLKLCTVKLSERHLNQNKLIVDINNQLKLTKENSYLVKKHEKKDLDVN